MTSKGTTLSQGKKHELDKFYTQPEIAQQCLNFLDTSQYDCIIEPSAGSGAFSNLLKDCFSYDIEPENDNIIKADYLTLDKKVFRNFENILVVGNPPFGSQGTLAHKFLIESMSFAQTVAFILPKGFKKVSMKNRIPLNFCLQGEHDLPLNAFSLKGKQYGVPTVFQIWERSENLRTKDVQRRSTDLFKFVSKVEADFRVQRVGGNAGKAFISTDASESSNYFLRNTSNYSDSALVETINQVVYPTIDDTTGPRSLSKCELIDSIESFIKIRTI